MIPFTDGASVISSCQIKGVLDRTWRNPSLYSQTCHMAVFFPSFTSIISLFFLYPFFPPLDCWSLLLYRPLPFSLFFALINPEDCWNLWFSLHFMMSPIFGLKLFLDFQTNNELYSTLWWFVRGLTYDSMLFGSKNDLLMLITDYSCYCINLLVTSITIHWLINCIHAIVGLDWPSLL